MPFMTLQSTSTAIVLNTSCCICLLGNFWVFRMKECEGSTLPNATNADCTFTTNTLYSDSDVYCKELVYDFVFYETIAKWAITGVLALFGCLCCCVMCCAYCCSSKE